MTNPTDSQPYAKVTVIVEGSNGLKITHTIPRVVGVDFQWIRTLEEVLADLDWANSTKPKPIQASPGFALSGKALADPETGEYSRVRTEHCDTGVYTEQIGYAPTEFPDPEGD